MKNSFADECNDGYDRDGGGHRCGGGECGQAPSKLQRGAGEGVWTHRHNSREGQSERYGVDAIASQDVGSEDGGRRNNSRETKGSQGHNATTTPERNKANDMESTQWQLKRWAGGDGQRRNNSRGKPR